jgi:hypothetical protein
MLRRGTLHKLFELISLAGYAVRTYLFYIKIFNILVRTAYPTANKKPKLLAQINLSKSQHN